MDTTNHHLIIEDAAFEDNDNDDINTSDIVLTKYSHSPPEVSRSIAIPRRAFSRSLSLPSSCTHSPLSPSLSSPASETSSPNTLNAIAEFKKRKRGRPRLEKDSRHCSNCGTNSTPEWRKGPNGPHTLCNACGLQYMKAQRKERLSPRGLSEPNLNILKSKLQLQQQAASSPLSVSSPSFTSGPYNGELQSLHSSFEDINSLNNYFGSIQVLSGDPLPPQQHNPMILSLNSHNMMNLQQQQHELQQQLDFQHLNLHHMSLQQQPLVPLHTNNNNSISQLEQELQHYQQLHHMLQMQQQYQQYQQPPSYPQFNPIYSSNSPPPGTSSGHL